MSSVAADGGQFEVIQAKPQEAKKLLFNALLSDRSLAHETFGDFAYQRYCQMYADWLHQSGDAAGADEAPVALSDAPDVSKGRRAAKREKPR
jgi:hypothetical protein